MQDHRKLEIWRIGHELTVEIYRVTAQFPQHERFLMVQQMRRAAYSIPSNIAEGCGRGGQKQLSYFSTIAAGSTAELEYFLYLSFDLGYLNKEAYQSISGRIAVLRKKIHAFRTRIAATLD